MADPTDLEEEIDALQGGSEEVTSCDVRDLYTNRAAARFKGLVKTSGRSVNAVAEKVLECDESAVRRPSTSLPMPWWLEAMIDRDEVLALGFARSIVNDVKKRRSRTGT